MPDAETVVVFMNVTPGGTGAAGSPAKFAQYRQQTDVVQDVSAFNTGVVNFTGGSFQGLDAPGVQRSSDGKRRLLAPDWEE